MLFCLSFTYGVSVLSSVAMVQNIDEAGAADIIMYPLVCGSVVLISIVDSAIIKRRCCER